MNFKKIHQEILRRSEKYNIIKREIEKNGIIKIQKSKLDLFTFITKTIISQQISDKAAQSLWKKFCLFFKTEHPNQNNIINKRLLNNALENVGISEKKKSYIRAFYNNSKKNLIEKLEFQDDEKFASFISRCMSNCAEKINADLQADERLVRDMDEALGSNDTLQQYASDCFTKHDTDGTGKLSQREAGVAVRYLYTELGTEPPEEAEVNELIVKSQKGEFDNDEEWVQFFSTMTQHALEAVEKSVGQRKKLAEAINAMAADAAWVKQQSSQSFAAADSDNSVC